MPIDKKVLDEQKQAIADAKNERVKATQEAQAKQPKEKPVFLSGFGDLSAIFSGQSEAHILQKLQMQKALIPRVTDETIDKLLNDEQYSKYKEDLVEGLIVYNLTKKSLQSYNGETFE